MDTRKWLWSDSLLSINRGSPMDTVSSALAAEIIQVRFTNVGTYHIRDYWVNRAKDVYGLDENYVTTTYLWSYVAYIIATEYDDIPLANLIRRVMIVYNKQSGE